MYDEPITSLAHFCVGGCCTQPAGTQDEGLAKAPCGHKARAGQAALNPLLNWPPQGVFEDNCVVREPLMSKYRLLALLRLSIRHYIMAGEPGLLERMSRDGDLRKR